MEARSGGSRYQGLVKAAGVMFIMMSLIIPPPSPVIVPRARLPIMSSFFWTARSVPVMAKKKIPSRSRVRWSWWYRSMVLFYRVCLGVFWSFCF